MEVEGIQSPTGLWAEFSMAGLLYRIVSPPPRD